MSHQVVFPDDEVYGQDDDDDAYYDEQSRTAGASAQTAMGPSFGFPSGGVQQGVAGFGGYDPAKVTKLKDGSVKRPRNDALVKLYNNKQGRGGTRVSAVGDTEIAWLIERTTPREEPQLHAWYEDTTKRARLDQWAMHGFRAPVHLKEVLPTHRYMELEKAVEEQPAILAFMNQFKTMAQRTSDSNALTSLTKTPRGAALVQMIASALGNPGRIDPAVLLKSFLDSVNQPHPADSELDQDLVYALESATNAEELANFRTWMTAELNAGRMTEEEHAAWIAHVARKTEELAQSGAGAPAAGIDAASAHVVMSAQDGAAAGGLAASANTMGRGRGHAPPPLGSNRVAPPPSRTFQDSLAGLGHGTSAMTEGQKRLRMYGESLMNPCAGVHRSPPVPEINTPNALHFVDLTEPHASARPSVRRSADEILNSALELRDDPSVRSLSVGAIALKQALELCDYEHDAAARFLIFDSRVASVSPERRADIVKRVELGGVEFANVLEDIVKVVENPKIVKRKASGDITLSTVRQFGECAFDDYNGADVSASVRDRRRTIIEECLRADVDEVCRVPAARAWEGLPENFTDSSAIFIASSVVNTKISEVVSPATIAALGEIASLARPTTTPSSLPPSP